MPTFKVVLIGSSGVGKTSLRGQYIFGRFSNGYRATIGADFISKSFPHPSNPAESVTLQIWDTAGQERFSSLSTAFFRGADAVLLMFDVNARHTMTSLTKWWAEFRDKAPLTDEDLEDYCCVMVGNKIDLVQDLQESIDRPVTEDEALQFLTKLIPMSPIHLHHEESMREYESPEHDPMSSSQLTARPEPPNNFRQSSPPTAAAPSQRQSRSGSIAIIPSPFPSSAPSYSPKHNLSKSRSRSSSRFYAGTMTSTNTSLSLYHTPSSSLFDVYLSARSSPEPWSSPESPTPPSWSRAANYSTRRRSTTALSSRSSESSALTITPSLFARESENASSSRTANTVVSIPGEGEVGEEDDDQSLLPLPPPPEHGPKLFMTSAKTGEGVNEVFEYIARRVARRREYEERMESKRVHFREVSTVVETVKLGLGGGRQGRRMLDVGCCGS